MNNAHFISTIVVGCNVSLCAFTSYFSQNKKPLFCLFSYPFCMLQCPPIQWNTTSETHIFWIMSIKNQCFITYTSDGNTITSEKLVSLHFELHTYTKFIFMLITSSHTLQYRNYTTNNPTYLINLLHSSHTWPMYIAKIKSTQSHNTYIVSAFCGMCTTSASTFHFCLSFCSTHASDSSIHSPRAVFLLPFFHYSPLNLPPQTSLSHPKIHPPTQNNHNPHHHHTLCSAQTCALGSSRSCKSPLCILYHNCISSLIPDNRVRIAWSRHEILQGFKSILDYKLSEQSISQENQQFGRIWAIRV